MLISQQGINFELNEENFTAKIMPSISIKGDVRIPKFLFNENKKFLITEISEGSFRNSNLKTLIIENDSSIKKIHKNTFAYSTIEKLHLSANIEELEEGWCHRTSKLISITISPENKHFWIHDGKLLIGKTKENDENLYFANRDIESVTIPSNIKEIKSNSFEFCEHLRTVHFSKESKLVKICKKSFSRSSIELITIPKHVIEICDKSFYFCKQIQSMKFESESELKTIGNQSFRYSSVSIDETFLSNLPTKYETLKNQISNEVIKNMYKKFSFKYYEKGQNLFFKLFLYLKQFKFIIFHMICPQNIKMCFSTNSNDLFNNCTSPTKTSCIFCVENECIIIEQVEIAFIDNLIKELEKQKISVINVSDQSYISIKPHIEANNEIENFYKNLMPIINKNGFLEYTYRSIIGYLIRRFYYPSDYFKDSSFFNFDQTKISKEKNIKSKLNKKLFITEIESKSMDVDIHDIIKEIKSLKNNIEESNDYSNIFSVNDFIELRTIYQKGNINYSLVIYTKTFYLFLMKKIPKSDLEEKGIKREILFLKTSHRCFPRFYGSLEIEEDEIGLIYEFMSGESLIFYIRNHSINEISFLVIISRIFEGIDFLHQNKLIHRDLKPSNILIDHDGNAYISDYETIRKADLSEGPFTNNNGSQIFGSPELYQGGNISYPTDIYSFGQIINYLFEETKIKFGIDSIRSLSAKCIKYIPEERIKNKEIKSILNEEFNLFLYLERYLFTDKNDINKVQINNFIFEQIYIQQTNESMLQCSIQIAITIYLLFIINKNDNSEFFMIFGGLYLDSQDYLEAIKYYKLSAKLNNSNALFNLGVFYEKGLGVEQDYLKAIKYYELSAKLNNSNALFNLGVSYVEGIGVEKNHLKGIEYCELSAKLNNSDALLYLGTLYIKGEGVEKNYLKGIKYYVLSAKLNNSDALLYLGTLYIEGEGVEQDYLKAIYYYELSAKLNNPDAFFYLGNIYAKGLGVEQDYLKAIKYYELSAKFNNSDALFNLGIFYEKGLGVEQDYLKAIKYFELSAELNNSDALLHLGTLYIKCEGVKQDYLKAIKYYVLSAKLNNSDALLHLGTLYIKGEGVEQDYLKAIYYYELSAKLNNPDAFFNLGNIYTKGLGVERDYLKAIKYFELSAKHNKSYAFFYLGIFYACGLGVEKNYLKAIKYYELSAKLNNSDALFNLGNIYACGLGVEKNYLKAIKYYELSSQLNNSRALYKLGDLYSNSEEIEINLKEAEKYFLKSINIERGIKIYNDIITGNSYSYFEDNNYRYISYNNLGLIYITDLKNIQKAEDNLKESAFAEYPFGQNNYGLSSELYLNKIENAKYMYERSSKHHFSIAEFNLGRILEKSKKTNESIKFYRRASNHEDEPLLYRNITLHDKRLEISKTFIICFTNLKLVEYYFLKNDYKESKKYFIRSFRKLKIITENSIYKFEMKINEVKSEDYSNDVFSYLKKFILNYPKFHLNIQPNLKDKPYSSIFKQIDINKFQDKRKDTNETKIESDKEMINEIEYPCEKAKEDNKMKDEESSKFSFLLNKKDNNFNEKQYLLSKTNFEIHSKYRKREEKETKNTKDYEREKKKISNEKIFTTPSDLFDFVIQKSNSKSKIESKTSKEKETTSELESESKLKTIFINEIRDIIHIMNDILHTEPYQILFGRITIKEPPKEKEKEVDRRRNIDQSFYEGFGIK